MLAATYETKKKLKESIGKQLHFTETSLFGPEYTDDGSFCVVGPSPYKRNWFASVVMKDGLIHKVS